MKHNHEIIKVFANKFLMTTFSVCKVFGCGRLNPLSPFWPEVPCPRCLQNETAILQFRSVVDTMIGAQEYSFLPETECHEILILYGQFYQVELSIKSLQYYGSVKKLYEIQQIRRKRLQSLISELEKKQVALRDDSKLKFLFLEREKEEEWPTLSETVSLIEEATYLNNHTCYRFLWSLYSPEITKEMNVLYEENPTYTKKHAYDIVHENWRERVKGDALKIQSLSQDNQEILSTLQNCFQDSVALPLKDLANKFKNHFGGRWDFSCLGLGALDEFLEKEGNEYFILGTNGIVYSKLNPESMKRLELDLRVGEIIRQYDFPYLVVEKMLPSLQNHLITETEFIELCQKKKSYYQDAKERVHELLEGKKLLLKELLELHEKKNGFSILPDSDFEETLEFLKGNFRWKLFQDETNQVDDIKTPNEKEIEQEEENKENDEEAQKNAYSFFIEDYTLNAVPLDLIEEIETETESSESEDDYY